MKTRHTLLLLAILLVSLAALTAGQAAGDSPIYLPLTSIALRPGTISLVSVGIDGNVGDDHSGSSALSADGRFIAISSYASNLVADVPKLECWKMGYYNCLDIYVRDQRTGETTIVSVKNDGSPSGGDSSAPSISADGRFVAFQSNANLTGIPSPYSVFSDSVYVHDRQTRQSALVSVATDGTVAQGSMPSISADGRYVVFYSYATNLVEANPALCAGCAEVYVHDRQSGETTLVSVASDGTPANDDSFGWAISADNRFVVFTSLATNLATGDTNAARDVFVHDRQSGDTTLVSVASDGTPANDNSWSAAISADGRFVVFTSSATNLVTGDTSFGRHVFIHDRQTGETARVSVASDGTPANGDSWSAAISADGRFTTFESAANNLVPDDSNAWSDIFLHDRQTRMTTRISVASDGSQGDEWSGAPRMSADGRFITFCSGADNLAPYEESWTYNIFVYYRGY